MIRLRRFLTELRRYPSALAGIIIILLLLITSIVVPIMTPYSEALRLWRGGEDIWAQYPRNAWPVWYNLFVEGTLPETIVFDSSKEDGVITEQQLSEGTREILFSYEFDYQYDDFPPEMNVFTKAKYTEKQPFVEMTWYTPDGRDIRLGEFSSGPTTSFRFAQEERLQRRLERETGIDNVAANKALFDDPSQEGLQPLKGTYRIELAGLLFEEDSELETTFVSYGLVHGIAGTDHRRRDLSVALLWGTPIAMAFGLLAAIGTTVTTMGIAAVGVWYGGWLDGGHVLFSKYLADAGFSHPAQHLWSVHQELSRHLPSGA